MGEDNANVMEFDPRYEKTVTRDVIREVDHQIEFIAENPQYLHANNAMDFLSDDAGETYNLCHCE